MDHEDLAEFCAVFAFLFHGVALGTLQNKIPPALLDISCMHYKVVGGDMEKKSKLSLLDNWSAHWNTLLQKFLEPENILQSCLLKLYDLYWWLTSVEDFLNHLEN